MNSLLTDPANHPASTPLTGERIERVIEALESSLKYRNGSTLDHVLADAVKGMRELKVCRETVPVVLDDLLSMAASAIEDLLDHTDPHTSYYSGVWADVPGKLRAALQERPKGAGAPQNSRSNESVQVLAGNSPVTPDGWIPVSERMPDPKSELRVCVYTPTEPKDIRYRFISADLFKAVCSDATHWHYMTEPAAPKEVG